MNAAAPHLALGIAGALSALAALLHLAIILGGAPWYRFFGAGERMARLAEAGHAQPALITLGIAVVLLVWAGYAWAAGGWVPALRGLPALRWGLLLITAVYLLRGLAPLVLGLGGLPLTPFLLWSSAICLGFGLVHLLGLVQRWSLL